MSRHTSRLFRRSNLDMSRFHLYDVMFDGAQPRGVTGYAHIAWAPEWYRRSRPQLFPTWDSTLNVIA
jgi:hypothetical protein